MNKIICVVGPTASGKTGLAVELARRYDGEVVSCDSMQIYRTMDIGTAKPTAEEMGGIVHHMIDVADPTETFSVSRYVQMADPVVQDILSRGKTCVICGGTGLYAESLMEGRAFAPYPETGRRQALEQLAQQEGIEAVLSILRQVDPESAARLHPSDRRRIIRAVEIWQETGMTITEHNRRTQQLPPKYRPLWIGLDYTDREELYRRIDLRVALMVRSGLWEEVERLLAMGVPPEATSLQAIGYKEPMLALRGEISRQEAVETIQRESRRYAKRQLTWFRRNKQLHWILRAGDDFDRVTAEACRLVEESQP